MQKKGPKPSGTYPAQNGIPDPPPFLDKLGKQHFKEVCSIISANGHLTKGDVQSLGLYSRLYSQWLHAAKMSEVEGQVITAKNGYVQPNPWHKNAMELHDKLLKYHDRFGFSPRSRCQLKAGDSGGEVIPPEWQEPE